MATLRAWRSPSSSATGLPKLQWKALEGCHAVVQIGGTPESGRKLPPGTQIIPDFRGPAKHGELTYSPKFDDSRMVPINQEPPPFSDEGGYVGAIRVPTLVQRHGLCSFLTTSAGAVRVLEAIYDEFVFAPEAQAGKLPIYRIEEPRSYHIKQRPDDIYSPVYMLIGWVDRDPNAFGAAQIKPPPLISMTSGAPALALPSDEIFKSADRAPEVLPPPASVKKAKKQKRGTGQQEDDDLNDLVPF
jgi:hypothetical protein